MGVALTGETYPELTWDIFDFNMGQVREADHPLEVLIETEEVNHTNPAELPNSWRAIESLVSTHGINWFYENDVLWLRYRIPSTIEAGDVLAPSIFAQPTAFFADEVPVKPIEVRFSYYIFAAEEIESKYYRQSR